MQTLFDIINAICEKIQIISDLFWSFPTNLDWYAGIPILGSFSLAIILLIGSGIYFTFRLRFIQIRKFKEGIHILKHSKAGATGISPLAAFFLSTAMRVGPGNILGVTGAIATGGPGALFWMWISAFFGMATAYTESTLAQIFKEKKDNEYLGGLAFYGKRLLKGSATVGIILSIIYIIYALLCFPAQGFNTISAVGQIAKTLTGHSFPTTSALYWIAFVVLMVISIIVSFGGIKKLTKVTDVIVPFMAVIYILTVLALILVNFDRIPWFFYAVFTEAFKPEAVFGGAFGIALVQGVKRGLMSNEAGQGTMTMAAAAADSAHPCTQGCVQSIGVFLDTIVICTSTGFVVVMGQLWQSDIAEMWFSIDNLPKYLSSAAELAPGTTFNTIVSLLISVCFGLFAFTCLLGFLSFAEICAKRISTSKVFINTIRVLCLVVIAFGILTNIVGLDLSALWNLSDFANILIAYCNLPLLYLGFKYVKRATAHYEKKDGTPFTSEIAGIDVPLWDEKAGK